MINLKYTLFALSFTALLTGCVDNQGIDDDNVLDEPAIGDRGGSWDGFLVPKPFASVRIRYLPPRFVARDASRHEMEALARALQIQQTAQQLLDAGTALERAVDSLTEGGEWVPF